MRGIRPAVESAPEKSEEQPELGERPGVGPTSHMAQKGYERPTGQAPRVSGRGGFGWAAQAFVKLGQVKSRCGPIRILPFFIYNFLFLISKFPLDLNSNEVLIFTQWYSNMNAWYMN
jgi:hypothetical protein